jgi:hypothetical protein
MKNIDWNNQFCIPVRETTEAQIKHLVVKSIITLLIKIKHSKKLRFQRVYPEFDLNGTICDIYHENWNSMEVRCYEIQKEVTPQWISQKNNFYNNKEIMGFKVDWILVNLKELSDDIETLIKQLKELI